ncbi:hypothetical protein OUZ56_032638 [Daphnia magna]|uniref:Uncharacterized protein n=1 Tax=Daphnia magna TaxID=35525 RepID=A0ABR0B9H6_9CRUS|nr:hypothetical protein OUZ56_032638 [Daphnia magna]
MGLKEIDKLCALEGADRRLRGAERDREGVEEDLLGGPEEPVVDEGCVAPGGRNAFGNAGNAPRNGVGGPSRGARDDGGGGGGGGREEGGAGQMGASV